jgi:hypothetical protein
VLFETKTETVNMYHPAEMGTTYVRFCPSKSGRERFDWWPVLGWWVVPDDGGGPSALPVTPFVSNGGGESDDEREALRLPNGMVWEYWPHRQMFSSLDAWMESLPKEQPQ